MELINFKCTQCSGSVTFQEDSDIAVCDYCGAELRFKQEVEKSHNEHKSELDALSDRITDLIEDQKYIQAEQASKEGLLSYPWAGRLHLYMLMCEFELNHPDLLGTCGKDYTRSANYKKCIRYMTEEDRNDLLMLVEKNQSSPSYKTAEAAMASSEKPSNYWEAQLKEHPNDHDAALLQKYATETNNRKANDEKTDNIVANTEIDLIEKIKKLSVDQVTNVNYVDVYIKNGSVLDWALDGEAFNNWNIEEVGTDCCDFFAGPGENIEKLKPFVKEAIDNPELYQKNKILLDRAALACYIDDMYYNEEYSFIERFDEIDDESSEEDIVYAQKHLIHYYDFASNVALKLNNLPKSNQIFNMTPAEYAAESRGELNPNRYIKEFIADQYTKLNIFRCECINENVYIRVPFLWVKAGYSKEILDKEIEFAYKVADLESKKRVLFEDLYNADNAAQQNNIQNNIREIENSIFDMYSRIEKAAFSSIESKINSILTSNKKPSEKVNELVAVQEKHFGYNFIDYISLVGPDLSTALRDIDTRVFGPIYVYPHYGVGFDHHIFFTDNNLAISALEKIVKEAKNDSSFYQNHGGLVCSWEYVIYIWNSLRHLYASLPRYSSELSSEEMYEACKKYLSSVWSYYNKLVEWDYNYANFDDNNGSLLSADEGDLLEWNQNFVKRVIANVWNNGMFDGKKYDLPVWCDIEKCDNDDEEDEVNESNDVRNQTNSSANTNQTVTPANTSPNIEKQEEPATKKKGSFFKSLLKELLK